MAGMTTQLNLLADHSGSYPGLSSQFSGDGFSGMRFALDAVPQDQFDAWVAAARQQGGALDARGYIALSQPSKYVAPKTYGAIDPGLFANIVAMKPAAPPSPGADSQHPVAAVPGANSKGY
jgi:cytochrome o ubiquinol oxidase subunit 2